MSLIVIKVKVQLKTMGIQELKNSLNKKTCYITCSGRLDGVGSQMWCSITTMIAAECLGFTFVYTPFQHVDHNDLNVPTQRWNTSWDNIFRICENSMTIEDWKKMQKMPKKKGRRVLMNWDVFLKRSETRLNKSLLNNYCYMVKESNRFVDLYHNDLAVKPIIDKTITKLQHQFTTYHTQINTPYEWFNPEDINVALHIRKGDVVEWNIATRIMYVNVAF